MEEVCGGDAPYMNTASLEEEHLRCRREAINLFRTTRKMGGTEFSMQYLDKLDSDLTVS
jgi:atlastin